MKDMTDITILLDRSGSMGPIKNDVIGGFNSFLDTQRKEPGEAVITLIQFDHEYQVLLDSVNLVDAKNLTDKSYTPRGSTALMDAIGRAVTDTGRRLANMPESDRPSKVLFIIITDGYENASIEFSRQRIASMIKHQTDVYKWEFVYIGANQDAFAVGTDLSVSNTSNFIATRKGVADMMRGVTNSVSSYRAGNGYTNSQSTTTTK